MISVCLVLLAREATTTKLHKVAAGQLSGGFAFIYPEIRVYVSVSVLVLLRGVCDTNYSCNNNNNNNNNNNKLYLSVSVF